MADLSRDHDDLYERVARIIENARSQIARTVNTALVHAHWLIGREIVEVEQHGEARAEYGEQLVRALASRLTERYGRGFSYPSVERMKQFFLTFPTGSALPGSPNGRTSSERTWNGSETKPSVLYVSQGGRRVMGILDGQRAVGFA